MSSFQRSQDEVPKLLVYSGCFLWFMVGQKSEENKVWAQDKFVPKSLLSKNSNDNFMP